ncbi:MAG: T9SS type A sorting domain-containing protein [Bacteroidales bacterium]|nr:T9SS type A sorting domain-containing protein [Bacteroidales bacterium]
MKTRNTLIFIFALVSLSNNGIFAQNAVCTPNPTVTDPEEVGVRYPSTLPVAFQGEYYNTVLTIIAPKKATTWGFLDITITKIQLTEMINIPSGLTWETNTGNSDDYMYAGEKYCMIVEGVTNDIAGIREVDVYANAWIRVIFETSAPGNPRNGGSVTFTLCNETSVDLGPDRTITTDDEIILSADQGTNFHTYLWNNNSTQPQLNICGNDLGVGVHEFSVMVFDTVGTTGIYSDREPVCYKEDHVRITVTQGSNINAHNNSNAFLVYPNPASSSIFVESNNTDSDIIEIVNQNGIIQNTHKISTNKTAIDISGLKNGIYNLVLKDKKLKTINNKRFLKI